MTKSELKTTPYDSAEYLSDEKDIAVYLNAAHEGNDPALIRHALSVVARAPGLRRASMKDEG
jgi:probable addiction module antidote protein